MKQKAHKVNLVRCFCLSLHWLNPPTLAEASFYALRSTGRTASRRTLTTIDQPIALVPTVPSPSITGRALRPTATRRRVIHFTSESVTVTMSIPPTLLTPLAGAAMGETHCSTTTTRCPSVSGAAVMKIPSHARIPSWKMRTRLSYCRCVECKHIGQWLPYVLSLHHHG